jgi:hypothetical protein
MIDLRTLTLSACRTSRVHRSGADIGLRSRVRFEQGRHVGRRVGSFAFIRGWNTFLVALMFLDDQEKFTVPVGLTYNLGENSVAFIQRHLVQGMPAGAVKG